MLTDLLSARAAQPATQREKVSCREHSGTSSIIQERCQERWTSGRHTLCTHSSDMRSWGEGGGTVEVIKLLLCAWVTACLLAVLHISGKSELSRLFSKSRRN